MTDDRPSIAELQRTHRSLCLGNFSPSTEAHATSALLNAAPVLLEIAAAALAWLDDPLELLNHRTLVAALSKVRP